MLIGRPSPRRFLGTSRRPLNDHLKNMGYVVELPGHIGYNRILKELGTHVIAEASRLHIDLQYRVIIPPSHLSNDPTKDPNERRVTVIPDTIGDEVLAPAEEVLGPIALDEELVSHVVSVSTENSDEQEIIDDRLLWRQDKRAL
jgi:hypothetical protein